MNRNTDRATAVSEEDFATCQLPPREIPWEYMMPRRLFNFRKGPEQCTAPGDHLPPFSRLSSPADFATPVRLIIDCTRTNAGYFTFGKRFNLTRRFDTYRKRDVRTEVQARVQGENKAPYTPQHAAAGGVEVPADAVAAYAFCDVGHIRELNPVLPRNVANTKPQQKQAKNDNTTVPGKRRKGAKSTVIIMMDALARFSAMKRMPLTVAAMSAGASSSTSDTSPPSTMRETFQFFRYNVIGPNTYFTRLESSRRALL